MCLEDPGRDTETFTPAAVFTHGGGVDPVRSTAGHPVVGGYMACTPTAASLVFLSQGFSRPMNTVRWSWLLLVIAGVLVSACQSTRAPTDRGPPAAWAQIEPGMTPAEVERVAGPPRRTIRTDGAVQWLEYGTDTRRVWIYVDDNVVAATPRPRPQRR